MNEDQHHERGRLGAEIKALTDAFRKHAADESANVSDLREKVDLLVHDHLTRKTHKKLFLFLAGLMGGAAVAWDSVRSAAIAVKAFLHRLFQ